MPPHTACKHTVPSRNRGRNKTSKLPLKHKLFYYHFRATKHSIGPAKWPTFSKAGHAGATPAPWCSSYQSKWAAVYGNVRCRVLVDCGKSLISKSLNDLLLRQEGFLRFGIRAYPENCQRQLQELHLSRSKLTKNTFKIICACGIDGSFTLCFRACVNIQYSAQKGVSAHQ